jgi:hypothetical protein
MRKNWTGTEKITILDSVIANKGPQALLGAFLKGTGISAALRIRTALGLSQLS